MIRLTRRYRFPAAHVLSNPSLGAEENRRIYGACANPAGHGHDYGVEVTVAGPVDGRSGQVMAPELLDEIFEECVAARFGHSMLNDDPVFGDRVPTTENLTEAIHERLREPIAQRSAARLVRVRVEETRRNSCVYGEVE